MSDEEKRQLQPARAASDAPKTIGDLLSQDKYRSMLADAVPQHLAGNRDRILRVMSTCVLQTPKLKLCRPMSLLGAMLATAALGLEPNTPLGHAYLIPFEKKRKDEKGNWVTEHVDVQFIIGYRGYIELARRSGNLVNIHADVVYEGEREGGAFKATYGTNQMLHHDPLAMPNRTKGAPSCAYAYAKLKDGEAFEVMPYSEVLKIRDRSEGYKSALNAKKRNGEKSSAWVKNPWVAHEVEMAKKTMIRRLAKYLPMAIEMTNAAQMEAFSSAGKMNWEKFANNRPEEAMLELNGETIDLETGEIINNDDTPQIEESDEKPMEMIQTEEKEKEAAKAPVQKKAAPAKAAQAQSPAAETTQAPAASGGDEYDFEDE